VCSENGRCRMGEQASRRIVHPRSCFSSKHLLTWGSLANVLIYVRYMEKEECKKNHNSAKKWSQV
jgi:hypothetical protein